MNKNVENTEEQINSWYPKITKDGKDYTIADTWLFFLADLTGVLPAGTLSLGFLNLESKGGNNMSFTLWLIACIFPSV